MFNKAKQFFKIDLEKLKHSDRLGLFWLDAFMIWLVIQNLLFFGFDWFFKFPFFQNFIAFISEPFYLWYKTKVHPYFANWDLLFIAVFFVEFMFRWIRAIRRSTYDLWWFYPFVHWYDVLGLIPMKGIFKIFRLFRIIGMIIKLQKIGVINIKKMKIYAYYIRFRSILVEEISDNVINNSLNMVQVELAKGIPLTDKIIDDVIKPKEDILIDFLANTINTTVDIVYKQHRTEFKQYLDTKVVEALKENKEIDTLRYLPGIGKVFQQMLDSAVSDVTFNVIDKILLDVASPSSKETIKLLTDGILDTIADHTEKQNITNQLVINMVHESIEIIKLKVLEKEWKNNTNQPKN
jgi:hypothetical protein